MIGWHVYRPMIVRCTIHHPVHCSPASGRLASVSTIANTPPSSSSSSLPTTTSNQLILHQTTSGIVGSDDDDVGVVGGGVVGNNDGGKGVDWERDVNE